VHVACESRVPRHKQDFGWESEAEKSEAIESARQHRADEPKSVATTSKPKKCGASVAAGSNSPIDIASRSDAMMHPI
jgi:hypothetical protein